MQLVLKRLQDKEWRGVPLKEVCGQSVIEYMLLCKEPVVACLYEGEQTLAFVSNNESYVDMYRHKGLSLHAKLLMELICARGFEGNLINHVFTDSEVVEIVA